LKARSGRATALDHDDGIRVRAIFRNLEFDISMPGKNLALRRVVIFSADKEMALLGDGNRPNAFGSR